MAIVEIFQNFFNLDALSQKSCALLKQHATPVVVKGRSTLLHRGQEVGGTYFVTKGRLRVFVQDINGNEKTVYWVEPFETCLFALDCAFKNISYPAWVESEGPETELLVLPSSAFKTLYDEEPEIRIFTFNAISLRVFDLMSAIEELSAFSLSARLASFLIRRASLEGKVSLSHQEIASYLGSAREVISRHLKKMEGEGLVLLKRGEIEILNIPGLNEFSI